MNNKKLRVLVLAGALAAVAYAGYQFGLRQDTSDSIYR
jgi:Cu(I)/Ag(I) efflux system membrane fusion protein